MDSKNTETTRIAYIDCSAGISGDMTLGALIDAGVPIDSLNRAIESLGLPNVRIEVIPTVRGAIQAQKAEVHYEPEIAHRHLPEILDQIHSAEVVTERAKRISSNIFQRLGEAEAKVHGIPIDEVHFHEVGAADSIADIVGTAVGFDYLGVERIVASPVAVGSGTVEMEHGTLSVPAPATAELLQSRKIPIGPSSAEAELATPTGAAILAELVTEFGPMPPMTVERIGYGAGSKDFESHANVVRLIVGQAATTSTTAELVADYGTIETVWMLETNLDDTPGEAIGYCVERCWASGALDVFIIPIQMKKNRPGVLLSVICDAKSMPALERILFEETTTLGVRRQRWTRRILDRREVEVSTSFGLIQGKVAKLPDGTERFSPEFDSCRVAAKASGVALQEVYAAADRAHR